jgi:hypothetical protein
LSRRLSLLRPGFRRLRANAGLLLRPGLGLELRLQLSLSGRQGLGASVGLRLHGP